MCARERGRIDLCLDLKMEPKALEGIGLVRVAQTLGAEGGRWKRAQGLFSPPHLSRRDLAGIREARSGLADPLDPGRATEKGFMKGSILSLSLK